MTQTVHGGAFCSTPGATAVTVSGTPVACTSTDGNRYRWRRTGPTPAREPRRRPTFTRGPARAGQGLERRYVNQLVLDADQPLPDRLAAQLNQRQIGVLRAGVGLPRCAPSPRRTDLEKLTIAGLICPPARTTTRGVDVLRRLGHLTDLDVASRHIVDAYQPPSAPAVGGPVLLDHPRALQAGEGPTSAPVPARDHINQAIAAPASQPAADRTTVVADDIRTAVRSLTNDRGGWISLVQLRDHLGDRYTRAEVDAALRALITDPEVNIAPEPNRHRIGDPERAAAVFLGGEHRHHIAVQPRHT